MTCQLRLRDPGFTNLRSRNCPYHTQAVFEVILSIYFDGSNDVIQSAQTSSCARCSTVMGTGIEVVEKTKEQPLWFCDECGKPKRLQERFHCRSCNDGNYDICASCVTKGIQCKDASHQLSYTSAICEHLAASSCQQCLLAQPFPGSGPVETFRILRQSWLSRSTKPCTHFVAVSYCWSTEKENQSRGRYVIRDADGRIRNNRVREEIIDRAVSFARESGCRFIWIDQVRDCICLLNLLSSTQVKN